MELSEKEIIKTKVTAFLMENDYAVVATSTKDGHPQAATVGYICDDDFNFFFLTDKTTRKVKNISTNPQVAVVIGTTKGVNTLQIDGTAEIVEHNTTEFNDIFAKISSISPAYHGPSLNRNDSDIVAVKVKSTWVRWRNLNLTTGKSEYTQIIP